MDDVMPEDDEVTAAQADGEEIPMSFEVTPEFALEIGKFIAGDPELLKAFATGFMTDKTIQELKKAFAPELSQTAQLMPATITLKLVGSKPSHQPTAVANAPALPTRITAKKTPQTAVQTTTDEKPKIFNMVRQSKKK